MSDERLRELEREAVNDPEAEERLAVERCRAHGHELLDLKSGMFLDTGDENPPRRRYPIKVKVCTRCGWMEQRLNVKGMEIVAPLSAAVADVLPARRFFLRDGSECPEAVFHAHYEDTQYRQIARDTVNGEVVSTVWLGCNLEALPGTDGERLVFGTHILESDYEARYETEEQARAGHEVVVSGLRFGPDPRSGSV